MYNVLYDCVVTHVCCLWFIGSIFGITVTISIMDAALVVTSSTTTSASRSYLLLTSCLMRENPDTAEFKSPVGEDEAATVQSGILLYIIWRGNSSILTVCM